MKREREEWAASGRLATVIVLTFRCVVHPYQFVDMTLEQGVLLTAVAGPETVVRPFRGPRPLARGRSPRSKS